jgi:LytR cell envelope-related transcriptional attenuator
MHLIARSSGHNQAMETWMGQGDDPRDLPPEHRKPRKPADTGQSPEAQARAFFRDGGDVVYDQPGPFGPRRRRWTLVALVVLVVAAASIAVAVFRPTQGSAGTNRPRSTTPTTLAKKFPLLAKSAVTVRVLNASDSSSLTSQIADGIEKLGFTVSARGNAPAVILSGNPSEIFYGSKGLSAAHTLSESLKGPLGLVADQSLTGNDVTLWIASPQLSVATSK